MNREDPHYQGMTRDAMMLGVTLDCFVLTGYVGFAGDIPIARVKLGLQHYRARHSAIVE